MGKLNWAKSAYAAVVLCAATAVALPAQTLTTLHSFDGTDGSTPDAGLVQATDGNLYGTAYAGGANGYGTVFKIASTGKLTTLYSFCSQGGCRDTSVTFNGTAATFRVVSKSAISTSVPDGATTGTVQVVTPSGTLSSNVPFRVAP